VFKDIKVGDKVLRQVHVVDGFVESTRFFIPAIVEKTTATRLEVDGRIYTKKDGREYGELGYSSYLLLQYSKDRDQSDDYREFSSLVKARLSSKDKLSSLMKKINKQQTSIEDLNEIINFCESMSSRINGGDK